MGVDVSFHIEVRRKNVWRPFIWQTPMEFCSDIFKKDEDKEWQTDSCCYWCRYYHFRDFIEDCAKRCTTPKGRKAVTTDVSRIYIVEENGKEILLGILTHNRVKTFSPMFDAVGWK